MINLNISSVKEIAHFIACEGTQAVLAILLQIARREFACCTSLGECPITHKGVTARFSDSL